jgi:hypothetical protein
LWWKSVLENRVLGLLKRQISPRGPTMVGRGVCSHRGPGAHGGPSQKARKKVIISKEVKSGYVGAPGAFRLWTPFSGIQRGDENPCYTHTTNSRHALQTQSAHAQTQSGRTPVSAPDMLQSKVRHETTLWYSTTKATEQHQEQQTPTPPNASDPAILCAPASSRIRDARTQQSAAGSRSGNNQGASGPLTLGRRG